ncbi:MAG: HAMP domain-containing histidine kinase [Alphaproteobacteria bacterium]|nr:HAMP domain-containing histidine kinase [Alphaproteobacteria bacterium]
MVLILNVSYVAYSYYQTSQAIQTKREALFLQTKKEINEALQHFSQYLNLTEARLSHSLDNLEADPEAISLILAEKIEESLHKNFPTLEGFSFFPTEHSGISYTKFGKTFHKEVKQNENIVYWGKGTFEWTKKLYNKDKHCIGILDSIFSLNKILHKYFSEKEVSIFPTNKTELAENSLSFKIDHLPYTVVVSSHPFTVWQFFLESKLHLLSIMLLSLLVFFVGLAAGASGMQHTFMKQRAFIHRLRDKLKKLGKKRSDMELQLVFSQNLLKRKETSQKLRGFLISSLNQRYRQMAGQAQAINMWTSQLILEEAQNDHLLQKIHSVSQEGTTVLRQLINGFPMKFIEEEIDVLECIEKVKEIFLPEIIEKNVSVEIKGGIQKLPRTDKVIFKIILHNIFHIVMDRLSKNGIFIIEIGKGSPLQLSFHDSGYDIGPKIQLVKVPPPPEDILRLDRTRLEELASFLDYNFSFENAGILTNTIKLTFPMVLEESERPTNVVNLFDFKSYEK